MYSELCDTACKFVLIGALLEKSFPLEPLETDKVLNWVKITDNDKKALVEKKKKKKQNDKKEAAAEKRLAEKFTKVDATGAAEKKKMEKNMEQAKRKAMNKEKTNSAKRVGPKKGASSKKGKLVGGGTKATRKAPKPVGTNTPKARTEKAKAAPVPKSKSLVGGVPPLKEVTPGSNTAKEDSKRDRRIEEKNPGACHHGTLLDLKTMNCAVLASYLRPGEYMNGMDCEECSKSCNDMRERDQFGTMLYYCDKSIVAWNLRDGDDGDDGKDGEICRLVLCRGCFVVRNGRVGGRRQRARCGN
jgi:hypothetical protein